MGKQAYKPRRPGLGINNWLKRRTAVKSNSMWFGEVFFKAIVASAPFTRFRPLDMLIQKAALLSKKHHTAGYSIPLNVDVADKIRPVTLPVDVMKKNSCRGILPGLVLRVPLPSHIQMQGLSA